MDAKDFQKWQQEKAKELFSYSHKLLDAAKQLSEHHIAEIEWGMKNALDSACLLYTSPSPRDRQKSRMPSSA